MFSVACHKGWSSCSQRMSTLGDFETNTKPFRYFVKGCLPFMLGVRWKVLLTKFKYNFASPCKW